MRVLQAASGAGNDYAVDLWACASSSNVQWLLDRDLITFQPNTGYCVRNDGGTLDVYTCSTSSNMQWHFTNVIATNKVSASHQVCSEYVCDSVLSLQTLFSA